MSSTVTRHPDCSVPDGLHAHDCGNPQHDHFTTRGDWENGGYMAEWPSDARWSEKHGEQVIPSRCDDCGRPSFYDKAIDFWQHAVDAGRGCFLIPGDAVAAAAADLLAELRAAGVKGFAAYHEVCDANEAVIEHMTEHGLDPLDHDLANKVTDLADRALHVDPAAFYDAVVDTLEAATYAAERIDTGGGILAVLVTDRDGGDHLLGGLQDGVLLISLEDEPTEPEEAVELRLASPAEVAAQVIAYLPPETIEADGSTAADTRCAR